MDLTFRQKAFLSKIIDLYREIRQPFHYSQVAEKLGVSKFTAYDMLRLLEQKGMVGSEYVTPKAVSGPGRSTILFCPTAQALESFSRLTEETAEQEEWEEAKAKVLTSLCQGKAPDYDGLLHELIAKIPQARSPLVYCAEVITALLVSLKRAKYKFWEHSPLNMLLVAPASKLGMSILAGVALGVALTRRVSQQPSTNLQDLLLGATYSCLQLTHENLEILHNFTQDVMTALARAA